MANPRKGLGPSSLLLGGGEGRRPLPLHPVWMFGALNRSNSSCSKMRMCVPCSQRRRPGSADVGERRLRVKGCCRRSPSEAIPGRPWERGHHLPPGDSDQGGYPAMNVGSMGSCLHMPRNAIAPGKERAALTAEVSPVGEHDPQRTREVAQAQG